MTQRILVIGAGIIGASCALALQRRGCDVTVVDERGPGEGCSFGNAGNISPGSVVPYSVPGSLRKVPRWLLDPQSPLSIRPAYFARFLPWGLRWLAASRREHAMGISEAMRQLHAGALDAYADMLRESGQSSLVRMSGQLYVSRVPGKARGSDAERAMREAAGVRVEPVDGAAIRDIEPTLAPHFQSGLWLPDNGSCVNPQRLVQVLAQLAVQHGAVLMREQVRDFAVDGPRVVGAILADGRVLRADAVVLAAGAWSARLLRRLGIRVPLEAERGYHVTLQAPGILPRIPTTNKDVGFAVAPMEMGLRFAGTAEYAGLDAPPDMRRARLLLAQGRDMFPGLSADAHTAWMGCRPSLPDGLPVLERMAGRPGLIAAFGNSHFGLTAAPRMGSVVASLALGETPEIDLAPFRSDRFSGDRAR
ncbi:FAD-dependent oxidoreductase [Burkholderia sp. WAC0059]|uniref:NAD(P)/FAD-dependent oxidoreductase n=1 Tax=Burkholderia sp. WAC0059 TaxID=2066022 RepID=UPI000C7EA2CC|nr:FAD-dependent oxidoreductase [Burkholderia sp. WAC0059]PLZ02371.1 FAD-dependent oxidoreductase [Burkholderia sp. WAC0059]